MSTETEDRPIFAPITTKHLRCEQGRMKMAVIFRDGIGKGCYWCKQPFADISEASLEHIIPLADGGKHELDNCALACFPCNIANVPKSVLAQKRARDELKERNRRINGMDSDNLPQCDPIARVWFDRIFHDQKGEPLQTSRANFLLRVIYQRAGKMKPSAQEKRIFKGHYNRWAEHEKSRLRSLVKAAAPVAKSPKRP